MKYQVLTKEQAKPYMYRVWFVINPPRDAQYVLVSDPDEALEVINYFAEEHLKDDRIEMNVFGLEVFEKDLGEWVEWYDSHGNDIIEYEEQRIRTIFR